MMFRGIVIFLLVSFFSLSIVWSQEPYDPCSQALELCPNQTYQANNIGATSVICPNCQDGFAFCFSPDNTVWFTFTTNAVGGAVDVNITNLSFQTNPGQDNELQASILSASAPCDASTYTALGNCEAGTTGNFTLTAPGLLPNTTYYVVVDGDNSGAGVTSPAEASFTITVSGTGINRLVSDVSITPSLTTACQGEIVTFTASVTNCPDTGDYTWYVDGILAATTTDPFFQTTELQAGSVVSVQTACYAQCIEMVNDTSVPVVIESFPLDAGPDQSVSPGQSVFLGGSTTATTYSWTPSFLVSNPSSLNPVVTPTETTTFTLTAIQNGCTLTDQATVFISTFIDIPNAFSPNNDDRNETWVIDGIEVFPNAQLKVFDRWGQQVFETIGYSENKAWNGTTSRGANLPSGVYYYLLNLNDPENQVFKGHVTLMR